MGRKSPGDRSTGMKKYEFTMYQNRSPDISIECGASNTPATITVVRIQYSGTMRRIRRTRKCFQAPGSPKFRVVRIMMKPEITKKM
jgi:hypothetical protein